MCKNCGCSAKKPSRPLYKCATCGKTAARPGKCCGKALKKS